MHEVHRPDLDKGARILRNSSLDVHASPLVPWLAEACVRYNGRSISVSGLDTNPVLYPFSLRV